MSEARPSDKFLRTRLRELRTSSGLTQEQVAEASGFSVIYYQSVEAGRRRNLPLHTIEQLAAVFGLTVHQFFSKRPPKIEVVQNPIEPAHYRRRNPRSSRGRKKASPKPA